MSPLFSKSMWAHVSLSLFGSPHCAFPSHGALGNTLFTLQSLGLFMSTVRTVVLTWQSGKMEPWLFSGCHRTRRWSVWVVIVSRYGFNICGMYDCVVAWNCHKYLPKQDILTSIQLSFSCLSFSASEDRTHGLTRARQALSQQATIPAPV